MQRIFQRDGDRFRVAHSLWLWLQLQRLGGAGAEPEPDKEARRLVEMLGVEQEFAVLSERLGVAAVVKGGRKRA